MRSWLIQTAQMVSWRMRQSDHRAVIREDLSEKFASLLVSYGNEIQHELNVTTALWCPPIEKLLLLVLHENSPLTRLLPKNQGESRDGISVRIVPKDIVLAAARDVYPVLAEKVKRAPKCGHLHYLVAIKDGVLTMCTDCDLGLRPRRL